MARKPNYRFERIERDRLKSAKRAERQKSKQDKTISDPEAAETTPAEPEQRPSDNA